MSTSKKIITKLPWYGVGTPYDGEAPDEFMKKCNLDWQVEKRPTFYMGTDNQLRQSDRFALVRTDNNNELSSVTKYWEEAQNDLLSDFVFRFNEYGVKKNIVTHSAGELNGGKAVWITASVDDHVDLFGGKDRIDSYLLFIISHTYGKSISISYLPSIMRCSNVIRKMLGSKSKKDLEYRISHRSSFDPEIAYSTLQLATLSMQEYADLAAYLGSKSYTKETLKAFLSQVYPSQTQKEGESSAISKPAKKIAQLIEYMPNADVGAGTWWSALNAVTYYNNHVQGKHQYKRWESLIHGQAKTKNTRALELAQEYAEMS